MKTLDYWDALTEEHYFLGWKCEKMRDEEHAKVKEKNANFQDFNLFKERANCVTCILPAKFFDRLCIQLNLILRV